MTVARLGFGANEWWEASFQRPMLPIIIDHALLVGGLHSQQRFPGARRLFIADMHWPSRWHVVMFSSSGVLVGHWPSTLWPYQPVIHGWVLTVGNLMLFLGVPPRANAKCLLSKIRRSSRTMVAIRKSWPTEDVVVQVAERKRPINMANCQALPFKQLAGSFKKSSQNFCPIVSQYVQRSRTIRTEVLIFVVHMCIDSKNHVKIFPWSSLAPL